MVDWIESNWIRLGVGLVLEERGVRRKKVGNIVPRGCYICI